MDIAKIKELRKTTGVGIANCKRALDKADGDLEGAKKILNALGHYMMENRSLRGASHGFISTYIHHNRQVGAMVEVCCETDFAVTVLRQFGKDLCMQIAATNPEFIGEDEIPHERLEEETKRAMCEDNRKACKFSERMLSGKIRKFKIERCLLLQKSVRDSIVTVGDLLAQKIVELGENIVIKRFCRFQVE